MSTNAFGDSRCPVRQVPAIDFSQLLQSCAVTDVPDPILECDDPEVALPGADGMAGADGATGACPTLQLRQTRTDIKFLAPESTPYAQIQVVPVSGSVCEYQWWFLFWLSCIQIEVESDYTELGPEEPGRIDVLTEQTHTQTGCQVKFIFQVGVPQGPRGQRGNQGPTGAQGPYGGPPGQVGGIGAQGPRGPTGPEGPVGPASTVQGPTGPDGPQGFRGYQGQRGQRGQRGPSGGPGGPGAQGPTGTGFSWRGAWSSGSYNPYDVVWYNNESWLVEPTSPPVGTAPPDPGWVRIAQRGGAGPQGPPGPGGPAGPAGATGPEGPTGPTGPGGTGPEGPTGPAGPDGPPGPAYDSPLIYIALTI